MNISGYTWASNVKGKLLPYEACIKSMLLLAGEVWVAYDPRYDDAETFTSIDPRVSVVASQFNIEEITGNGDQLSEARKRCTGDWLIWLDLDELIHEKDARTIKSLIEFANDHDYECIEISLYNYLMKCYTFGSAFVQWCIRPKFLKNVEGVLHGIPEDAKETRDDGSIRLKYGDGIDFVKDGNLYRHRSLIYRDYPFLDRVGTGVATCSDILMSTTIFPYIYHYSRYSYQRKAKMNTHQRDVYFQGHSDDYNPVEWATNLSRNVELIPCAESPDDTMIGPVISPHPAAALPWINTIDTLLERR